MKVNDALNFQSKVNQIVRNFNGIIEDFKLDRNNQSAWGTITFKVLPKHLDSVLGEVKMLGVLETENASAEDVTGQYVDTEARLNNLKMVRDRLMNLLTSKTDKMADILKVEHELARVTGEIEVMESRIKLLAQTVALATVLINYHEDHVHQYKFLEGYSFKESLRGVLESAVKNAAGTVNYIVLALGFFVPIACLVLIVGAIVLIGKKFRKK